MFSGQSSDYPIISSSRKPQLRARQMIHREAMVVMTGAPPSFPDHNSNNNSNSGCGGSYMEKRQVFLRSYHFSRKKTGMEKARCSAVRVRKLICVRLRAARRLPRLLWYRLRCAWYAYRFSNNSYGYGYGRSRRRFRFQRLVLGVVRPTTICSGDSSC